MDSSPSSVLTLGLGSWGSTGLVLTLGFSTGGGASVVGRWHDPVLLVRAGQIDIESLRTRTEIVQAGRVEAT